MTETQLYSKLTRAMALMNTLTRSVPLLEEAEKVLGREHRLNKAQEECGELVTVISQRRDGRKSDEEYRQEIADVLLAAFDLARMEGFDDILEKLQTKMDIVNQRVHQTKLDVKKEEEPKCTG